MKKSSLRLAAVGFYFGAILSCFLYSYGWLATGDAFSTASGMVRLHDLYAILVAAGSYADFHRWNAIPFVYPPLLAFLWQPVPHLRYENVWPVWLLFSIVCWVVAIGLCRKVIPGLPRIYGWLALPAFFPFYWCLAAGQNSALSLLLIVSAIYFGRRSEFIFAGLCFLLLFYKPQFQACLFLAFLVSRQWRMALGVLAAAVAGLALGMVLCGWDRYVWFFETLLKGSVTGFNLPINYTFLAFLKSMSGIFPLPMAWLPVISGAILVGILWFWAGCYRQRPFSWDRPERFFFTFSSILMASPYFAVYDMTVLVICFLLSAFWSLKEVSWSLFAATVIMILSTYFSILSWQNGLSLGIIPWALWTALLVKKSEFELPEAAGISVERRAQPPGRQEA